MAGPNSGAAIFSTQLGRYAPRLPTSLPSRIILRSCPDEDMEAKITELQANFPDQCKALKSPIANLYDYFDNYDQDLHGSMFLGAVLEEICGRNLMRRQSIINFTQQWSQLNPLAFQHVLDLGLDAFTADDMEAFGEDFLKDALGELHLQKLKYDDAGWHPLVVLSTYYFTDPNLVGFARNRDSFPVRVPPQLAIRAPFPVIPQQEQQTYPNVQRQFSDPSSLHSAVVRPQLPGPIPASNGATPVMSQVFPTRAPFPPPMQLYGPMKDEVPRPTQTSRPVYPPGRTGYDFNSTHVNNFRTGFPDMFLAAPPRGVIPEPHPYYQVPPGDRGYNQPSNKLRSGLKSKGSVYVGPSNDARILEHQGVPKGRITNRNHSHSAGSQMYNSRQYLPSQPNQSSWTPYVLPCPPPPSSGSPTITPSRLANGMVTVSADHGSSAISGNDSEGQQQTGQQDLPRPHAETLYATDTELTSPAPMDANPREFESRKQAPYPHGGRMHSETTTPYRMHRSSVAGPIGSPTLRRFSNTGEFAAKQYNRQYHNTLGSRGHRFEMGDYPVSDRKVWIGGLPPKTDIGVLAQLLDPYEPFELSKVHVSTKYPDSKSDYAGFTFAEFENPQRATDAIEAFNGRFIESMQCRLFLKPARLNHYSNHTVSPQKSNFVSKSHAGRQNSNHLANDYGRTSTDGAPQETSTRITESPSKRDKLSDEGPLPGNYFHQDTEINSGNVSAPEGQEVHNTLQEKPHIQNAALGAHNADSGHGLRSKEGNALNSTPLSAMELAVDLTPAVALELPFSPSPKTPKSCTSMEAPPSEEIPQPKPRKEILSNLRTERPNATALKTATDASNLCEGSQTETSGSALQSSTTENSEVGQADAAKPLGISASDLNDELEHYAAFPRDESGEGLSRAHSNSTSRRRMSSASVFLTTDPTSYAQSECGTGGVRTPVTLEADAPMSHASPISTVLSDSGESIAQPQAEMAGTQPFKLDPRTTDEAILASYVRAESPPATKKIGLQTHEGSATSASTPMASAPTTPRLSSPDLSRKVGTVVQPWSTDVHESRPVDQHHLESLSQGGRSSGSSEQPSKKENILPVSNVASTSVLIPENCPAIPTQDVFPETKINASRGSSAKRGLPKDPKTLVAVPKLSSLTRVKPQTGKADTRAPSSSLKPRTSTESLDPAKSAVTEPHPVIKGYEETPVPVSATFTHAEEGQAPMSLSNEEAGLASLSFNKTDQQFLATAIDGQGRTKDLKESCELASIQDSVATLTGDIQDSIHKIPQSEPSAIIDLEEHGPRARSAEQQPIIQQKKRKSKKGKKPKKSKPSPESAAKGSSPTHSQSSIKEEIRISALVPKAETPYLADDNTPLPQPSFVRQNHSSMRSRKVDDIKNVKPTRKIENDCSTLQVPEAYADTSSNSAARSQGLIVFIFPGESSDAAAIENGNNKATEVETHPLPEVDQRKFSQEERAARLRKLDQVAQERQLAPIGELLKALAIVAPRGSRVQDDVEGKSCKSTVESIPDTLAGSSDSKITEVLSDDENQTPSLPSAQPREQEPGLALVPDEPASPLLSETTSGEHQESQVTETVERSEDRSGKEYFEDHMVTSFPSTRTVSPERGRGRSLSPAKGLAKSVTHPMSIKSENVKPSHQQIPSIDFHNVSPSRKQAQKPMCWSDAVIKSTSPSIQAGDIVEITTKKSDGEGKGFLGRSAVHNSGSRDPWRVPSAEQEWGASSKSKSKPSTEGSIQKK
ncbi:MAG: hypothetical protein Q9182_000088 [Xanthomendoza sp. 2 TL-2023]